MRNKILQSCLILFCSVAIRISAQVAVPYASSFESPADTAGWRHYALSGSDDWELGMPLKSYFNSVYYGVNAWVTKLTGNYLASSNRCIETPYMDLTDIASRYYISFYHQRQSSAAVNYYMEYSLDQGSSWLMLSGSYPQKNWQSVSSGWTTYSASVFENSTFSIFHLQGNDSVKFRFRFNSTTANGDGWMIDDFRILEENFDITASAGPIIGNLNKNFLQYTAVSNLGFFNPFSNSHIFHNEFYFSKDTLLDASDSLIGTFPVSTSTAVPSYSKTFNLPSGLYARDYYIFYKFDLYNVVSETNETNNTAYTILRIDSIFAAPFIDHFDHSGEYWNASVPVGSSFWYKGDPNLWQMEDPHSGANAWYANDLPGATGISLQTPYIDLSGSVNSVMCLWYREARQPIVSSSAFLYLPLITTGVTSPPAYTTTYTIPNTRDKWDCFCYDLSAYDGVASTKFKFHSAASQVPANLSGMEIDDVYIGTKKPDLSIEGNKRERFYAVTTVADTLRYKIFNSGLTSCPASQTDFYWSVDSILDAGDLMLGSNSEISMTDTSFRAQKFIYTKPTSLPGTYYIIYSMDALSSINEMREYNNIGYFEIIMQNTEPLPYFNDFEVSTNGWYHNAPVGTDDWICSTPAKPNIPGAFSGTKAWVTKAVGNVSIHSRMNLYSPLFDLTQLSRPVIDFDMINQNYGSSSGDIGACNISYSIDGGYTWINLSPKNRSFSRWDRSTKFEENAGSDKFGYIYSFTLFEEKTELQFINSKEYQMRDADEVVHFCMDMSFLNTCKDVRLRFSYVNDKGNTEGAMFDNFRISEGRADFEMPERKHLYSDSTDALLRFNFSVRNSGNYISTASHVDVYLSADSLIGAGDQLLNRISLDSIRPYYRTEFSFKDSLPLALAPYNYVIFQLDPLNVVAESDETNNTRSWPLDIQNNPTLPYFNDFSANIIDGWKYYIDSTLYWWGHRFRNKKLVADPVYDVDTSGEFFLDLMNTLPSALSAYPRHYLETPSFDFSTVSDISMEFDLLCLGYNGSGISGGNAQYSIDGGRSWILLTIAQDPLATNWYNIASIGTLFNQPGWGDLQFSTFKHAIYNLSFLAGNSNVRIRFQYKSNAQFWYPGLMGFRLDNFKVGERIIDLVAVDSLVPISADPAIPYFNINYTINNIGSDNCDPAKTNFYWSSDNVFDAADTQLYSFTEPIINAFSSLTASPDIYYPLSLTQSVYYLFYKTDNDSVIYEVNEGNNTGSYVITFVSSGVDETAGSSDVTHFVSNSELNVECDFSEAVSELYFALYNSTGQLVLNQKYNMNGKGLKFKIPLQTLAKGVYFGTVYTNKGNARNLKFVISK